jgi:hypothetical protein
MIVCLYRDIFSTPYVLEYLVILAVHFGLNIFYNMLLIFLSIELFINLIVASFAI